MASLLGFDFGLKNIGVASGQTLTGTATPLTTLRPVRNQPDWERIARLIDEWRPDALVVGVPLADPGHEESPLLPRVQRFARQLEGRFRLPVHLIDERLTTREAESLLGEQKYFSSGRIDALSAALILETWLHENPN